jgi:hypothetical protein
MLQKYKEMFCGGIFGFGVSIIDTVSLASRRLSSCFRSVSLSIRRSLPSLIRKSKAQKYGAARCKRRSRNCGLPRLSKHTISPSSTVCPSWGSSEGIDWRRSAKELNKWLLREIN